MTIDSLSIILWNVAMTPSPPPNIGTRDSKSRAPKIAEILSRYDIAIVNESFLYRDLLFSLMKEHPYVYTDPRIWYKVFNSGVVIISKIPLINTTYKHYTKESNWDWFTSKGLIGCSFKFGTEVFDLYGTHMQAGNSVADQTSRFWQANEVAEQVKHTHHYDHNLIICGDFNCGPTFDADFKSYSSHYSDEMDARLRNSQFDVIKEGTGTRQLFDGAPDTDISSFLYKERIGSIYNVARMLPAANADGLSDTGTLCIKISRRYAE